MRIVLLLFVVLFNTSLSAQVEEGSKDQKAKVNLYKFQTGELSQIKDLDLNIVESYFDGNEPDDSVTIEIVFKKRPSIYRRDKTRDTYIMKTEGVTSDLEELLQEVEKFKALILEVNKE